ncbi:hypothetical protein [Abyssalbus ytuae]|uniref:Uncharacterized protein n=1 Tax=Abyssalbus ytuae TaxID=2926907 RepID=A0A9E6ZKT6_9FLAO|nr:hypothetical protein [Abyssalbus ytuae]UOB17582.1 hypothetical protein MQE35_17815 [Abyssalbus ytuae]
MTNFLKHKIRRKTPGEIAGWILFGIFAIVALAILFGYIIMSLWNWLMPEIFGLTTITYWQAVGIFILFKILLGGCGGGGGKHHKSSRHSKKSKSDFSKWEYYDKFWTEVGDKTYEEYVRKIREEENNPET